MLEGILLLVWMLVQRTGRLPATVKGGVFWLVMLIPVLVNLGVNMSDSYLKSVCSRLGIGVNGAYVKAADERQKRFTSEEITGFATDAWYRFDVLADNFANCNLLAAGNVHKTAMYSSVTNTAYATFYYDVMRNPVSLNNRVALVPDRNCCFSYFMGMKYILTDRENVPFGYRVEKQKGDYVLARNDNVLPICYGTTDLLSVEEYGSLEFPDTLEALCTRAVVPGKTIEKFTSHFVEESPENFFAGAGADRLLHPSGKKEKYTLPLAKTLQGKMVVISFHVESSDGKAVIISINGMKNKLSGKEAPYPNHNHVFTYVLPVEAFLDELCVELSEGRYMVDNLKIYTADYEELVHSKVVEPVVKEDSLDNCNVFEGEIIMEEAGYFITSYPYRKGYQVKVDDVLVSSEKVNTAFLGFPVDEGRHQIEISYEAPGYKEGCVVSIISCILLGILIIGNPYCRKAE